MLFKNFSVPQNFVYLLFLLSVSLLLLPAFLLPSSVTEGSNTWIEFKQELGWFFPYPLVMIGLISTNTSHHNLCLLGDPRDVNDYANNSGYKFSFRRRGGKETGKISQLSLGHFCHKHVTGPILNYMCWSRLNCLTLNHVEILILYIDS